MGAQGTLAHLSHGWRVLLRQETLSFTASINAFTSHYGIVSSVRSGRVTTFRLYETQQVLRICPLRMSIQHADTAGLTLFTLRTTQSDVIMTYVLVLRLRRRNIEC